MHKYKHNLHSSSLTLLLIAIIRQRVTKETVMLGEEIFGMDDQREHLPSRREFQGSTLHHYESKSVSRCYATTAGNAPLVT